MPNITSRSNKFTRYWYVTVDDDVEDIDENQVGEFIMHVLNDPRGLTKFGYKFQRLPSDVGHVIRQTKRNWRYVFHIRIASNKTVRNECKMDYLSCAQLFRNVILLNEDRWKYASEYCRLSLTNYRIYCINHEVLHLLSRGHAAFPKSHFEHCPVMVQQTIARGRCIENPWPQDDE